MSVRFRLSEQVFGLADFKLALGLRFDFGSKPWLLFFLSISLAQLRRRDLELTRGNGKEAGT